MKQILNRRQFIRLGGAGALSAAALPAIVSRSVLGGAGNPSPSERIQVGCIGVGPQGRGVMGNFLSQESCRVVALCDVAGRNLDAAVKMVQQRYPGKGLTAYHDFRELLAREDIDAVLIATPDHWHVPVAIAAARAGKDMYLEKPMGLSVEEDRMLRRVCQQKKRIFQFGTQQRSSRQFRQACELVRNGRIGKLKQINVWCSASRPGGSTQAVTPPKDLDYDLWLGPAPKTPYTPGKGFDGDPPGSWKTWWFNYDYALGFIAGWGVHPLDIAYWGYPEMMSAPFEVDGRGVIPDEGACNTSVAWDVNFSFPSGVRLAFRGVRNNYDQATSMNDIEPWRAAYGRAVDHGTAFEGTDGWVLVDRGAIRTSSDAMLEDGAAAGDVRLTKSSHHAGNFLESVQSRQPAICPVEDAVQSDILCHVSDIATRVDRKLTWNPRRERFVRDREANARLKMRPMRAPWKLG